MMKLNSIRSLEELRPVLKEPDSSGPDPVYWVFAGVSKGEWENLTILAPGLIGSEFTKTFGHYHGTQVPETYLLVKGEGVLVLQKKCYKDGIWIPEKTEEVILMRAKAGDKITIDPEFGHSWSNIGNEPLILLDDWRAGHTDSDYQIIKELKGMAYYLKPELNKEFSHEPNPSYQATLPLIKSL